MQRKKKDNAMHTPGRDRGSKNKILWIYGLHQGSVSRFMRELFQNDMKHDTLKIEIGIPFNCLLIPVPAWIENRANSIKALTKKSVPKSVILAEGVPGDVGDIPIMDLYRGAQAVFVNPGETQFHIDTGITGLSYKEARQAGEELKGILLDCFEQLMEVR